MFWAITVAMTAVVLAAMLMALIRAQPPVPHSHDMDVYRDQLASVETDIARGVVSGEEAERLKVEIKRRILEADRTRRGAIVDAPRQATLVAGGLTVALVLGGVFLGYQGLGAPGYPDLPIKDRLAAAEEARQTRPDQATAEASLPPATPPDIAPEFADLMEKLRATVAQRPDDMRGLELLARNEAGLENYAAAYDAQSRIVALKGETATADDLVGLADLMILAAGGYVSPQAEAVLVQALQKDRANPVARYYIGLMHSQTGRPDMAFRFWEQLLRQASNDDPWVPPIRAQIEEMAIRAGIDYTLPPEGGLRGPTAEDMANAGQMSVEDRMAMISGMVANLGERLATEGGPPEEWARLIRSLAVLNRMDEAAKIWAEAQQVFPDPATRVAILSAAQDVGLEQ